MKSLPNTYILSPILHKDEVELSGGVTLSIDKSYSNNLRDRNPQLGVVEAVNAEANPLNLTVGDIVAVNHFTFYGDIGANKSFNLQPHVPYEGRNLFKATPTQILFKYNNKIPEAVGDVIICTGVKEREILGFDPNAGAFFHNYEFEQRGTVLCGGGFSRGEEVLTLRYAMYLITLDRVDYFKCLRSEIVATVRDGVAYPTDGNFVIEYLPDEYQNGYSPLLVGTGVHIVNNVTARVVAGSCEPDLWVQGEANHVQAYRNQGVQLGNQWIVNKDNLVYGYETA